MLGWSEITTGPESDQLVHDPCTLDEDTIIDWSYGRLVVEAVIQELPFLTDVHHTTGRLLAG